MSGPFRILSLSGGGVRGIFQATALRELEKQLDTKIASGFDLIAGTSTGAICALAVAFDVPLDRVLDFYRDHAASIFRSRLFAGFRRGPRYGQPSLRECLNGIFRTKQLRDSTKQLIIPAATIDRFEHRVFSNITAVAKTDGMLSAVDVALASAAAPTYFPPVKPAGQERSYLDGGVWANSPSLLAVLVAHRYLGIALSDIRVLSVGTAYFPEGRSSREVQRLRPYSVASVRTLLELIWSSQGSFADEYAQMLLPPGNFHKIDVPLKENLELDDVPAALLTLPPLAERQAQSVAKVIGDVFFASASGAAPVASRPAHIAPASLVNDLIPAAGLTAFYPSREYYRTHRTASSIDTYVATARKTVTMVSINLMTGVPFDGLCDVLRRKLETPNQEFSVVISLLDPFNEHLMQALAPVLDMTHRQLSESIQGSLGKLLRLKASLSQAAQKRLMIRVHGAIPLGSAILLDHCESFGRIQIETKVYKAHVRNSFAFEVIPTGDDGFYHTLKKGYEALLDDGEEVTAGFLER